MFSALCSSESVVAPYATATYIGEKPLSKEQFSKLRRDTLRPRTQAAASCHIDQEVTSADSGGQHVPHVPECDLELTLKLSKAVFFGRYYRSSLNCWCVDISVGKAVDCSYSSFTYLIWSEVTFDVPICYTV